MMLLSTPLFCHWKIPLMKTYRMTLFSARSMSLFTKHTDGRHTDIISLTFIHKHFCSLSHAPKKNIQLLSFDDRSFV
jgi:hypothetical protein